MASEGIIALIWAAAGTTFYDGTQGLAKAFVTYKGAGGVVYDICSGLMGTVGTIIEMIGVIACPVSSAIRLSVLPATPFATGSRLTSTR